MTHEESRKRNALIIKGIWDGKSYSDLAKEFGVQRGLVVGLASTNGITIKKVQDRLAKMPKLTIVPSQTPADLAGLRTIIKVYVSNNKVEAAELPKLIKETAKALYGVRA